MPSIISMRLFPNPEVGMTVQWFPRANNTRKETARSAIITQVGSEGRVSLTMFSKGVGPRSIREVRHVLDPIHKRKTEVTMTNGGWDFIPGPGNDWRSYRPEIADLTNYLCLKLPEVDDMAENDFRQEVVDAYSQGSSVEQIAAALDEPRERVRAVVDELLSKQDAVSEDKKSITIEEAKQMVEKAVAEALASKEEPKPRGRPRKKPAEPVSEKEKVLN